MLAAVTAAAAFAVPPGRAGAQTAGRMGPYERALRLVEAGRGAEGRALTDSLVLAAGPGSPALAEALWWRATLAGGADSAERDLRRLIAEVPASPRTGPATVRLAQLALLRDRPDDATRLLEPLVRTRAGDPVRPVAGYWLARARLERRDPAGACAALDGASGAPVFDVDLARQLAGLRRRVPGCGGAAVAAVPPPSAAVPSTAVTAPPVVVGSPGAESGATVSSGIASGAAAGAVASAPAAAMPSAPPPTATSTPATAFGALAGAGGSAGTVTPPAAVRGRGRRVNCRRSG